jgi:hypothetical protein
VSAKGGVVVPTFTFAIDLNMLRGDVVATHLEMLLAPVARIRDPEPGDRVIAVDEDDARHEAVVESLDGDWLILRLNPSGGTRLNPPFPGSLTWASGERPPRLCGGAR